MHLSFEVDDMDAALQRLKEISIKPEGEPIILQEEDGTNLELIVSMGHSKERIRNNKPIWKAKIIPGFQ
ncbi:VOC family protein [Sphingobacterium multivorum]|uniref:VOC family protein n=1 Tax=Sphingobacterium multivorum TaxID=28454 RepID=UPI003DA348E5